MSTEPAGAVAEPATAPLDDFRAAAAAFSQLTGVLGGFCITIFVLVLDSTLLGEHQTAQDWVVGLLLLAGLLYISASGIIANSMNVPVLRSRIAKYGLQPGGEVFAAQKRIFSAGIALFHAGNVFLPAALVVLVYQHSLTVGLLATGVIAAVATRVVLVNAGVFRRRYSQSDESAE